MRSARGRLPSFGVAFRGRLFRQRLLLGQQIPADGRAAAENTGFSHPGVHGGPARALRPSAAVVPVHQRDLPDADPVYTHHTAGARVRLDKGAQPQAGSVTSIWAPTTRTRTRATTKGGGLARADPRRFADPRPGGHDLRRRPAEPTLGQVFRDTYKPGRGDSPGMDAEAAKKLDQKMERPSKSADLQKKIEAAGGANAFSQKMTSNIQQKALLGDAGDAADLRVADALGLRAERRLLFRPIWCSRFTTTRFC